MLLFAVLKSHGLVRILVLLHSCTTLPAYISAWPQYTYMSNCSMAVVCMLPVRPRPAQLLNFPPCQSSIFATKAPKMLLLATAA